MTPLENTRAALDAALKALKARLDGLPGAPTADDKAALAAAFSEVDAAVQHHAHQANLLLRSEDVDAKLHEVAALAGAIKYLFAHNAEVAGGGDTAELVAALGALLAESQADVLHFVTDAEAQALYARRLAQQDDGLDVLDPEGKVSGGKSAKHYRDEVRDLVAQIPPTGGVRQVIDGGGPRNRFIPGVSKIVDGGEL